MEHSSRILADAGWEVVFLGTGAFGADALRFPPHPRITVQRMPFCPPGPHQKWHYSRYAAWVLAGALRWRPAWAYASDLLSCPIALLLTGLPRLRVLYHEHDSPTGESPRGFSRLALVARRLLARRADLVVLPNAQRARCFTEDLRPACPVLTVWNCPARDEVARRPRAEDGLGLTVLYHGSIGPATLPAAVVGALGQLPSAVRLRVVGYETVGHLGYMREVMAAAREAGVGERVEIVPAVPRFELLALTRQADVGLALLSREGVDVNHRHMVGASNKPFDYLASGLPVLVPDAPAWRETFVEPGYGLACDPDDPQSIAQAIRWFLDHPDEMRAMGERGRQRILNEWNYETQFAPVLQRFSQS